jgi:hypothetical protein
MPGFTPGRLRFRCATPHQLAASHRTPFVRHLARMLAAITRTRDRKESRSGLRGKVAFRSSPSHCSEKARLLASRALDCSSFLSSREAV